MAIIQINWLVNKYYEENIKTKYKQTTNHWLNILKPLQAQGHVKMLLRLTLIIPIPYMNI